MNDIVDINNLNTGEDDLGTLWSLLKSMMIEEQFEICNRAYNLISVVLLENGLSQAISTVLLDDLLDTPNKINQVKLILINALIDLITRMGIIVNLDFVDLDSLSALCDVIETLFITNNIEDHFGLMSILTNDNTDNKDKFIDVSNRLLYKDNVDVFEDLIEEVSGDTIKGIILGINANDDDYTNPDIIKRIRKNKSFLKDTLSNEHILNNGMIGAPYDILVNTYINELAQYLIEDKQKYLKEVMGLCLISSMTDIEIESGYEALIKDHAETLDDIMLGNKILRSVVF